MRNNNVKLTPISANMAAFIIAVQNKQRLRDVSYLSIAWHNYVLRVSSQN